MKAIIAGSRRVDDYEFVSQCILNNPHFAEISEIVEGGAAGVDRLAARFAATHNLSHVRFHADWIKHGMSAGPLRNQEMIRYVLDPKEDEPAILIAIPTEDSRGTKNIIEQAEKIGLQAFIHLYQ